MNQDDFLNHLVHWKELEVVINVDVVNDNGRFRRTYYSADC